MSHVRECSQCGETFVPANGGCQTCEAQATESRAVIGPRGAGDVGIKSDATQVASLSKARPFYMGDCGLVALAQACLDGEDFGMSTADLVEDLMHEVVRLGRDNANLEHHYRHHRGAGVELHTKYCELRGLLMKMQRMANDAVGDLDPEIEREHEAARPDTANDIALDRKSTRLNSSHRL